MARHVVPPGARGRAAGRREARRPSRPAGVHPRRPRPLRARVAGSGACAQPAVPDRVPRRAGDLGRRHLPERRRTDPRADRGGSPRRRVRARGRIARARRRSRATARWAARPRRGLERDLLRQSAARRRGAPRGLAGRAAPAGRPPGDRVRLAGGDAPRRRPLRRRGARDREPARTRGAPARDPAARGARGRVRAQGAAPPRSRVPAALLRDPRVRRRERGHRVEQSGLLLGAARDADPAHAASALEHARDRRRPGAAVRADGRVLPGGRAARGPQRAAAARGSRLRGAHRGPRAAGTRPRNRPVRDSCPASP